MVSTTAIGNGRDVVSFLKSQHEQIKALFQQTLAAGGEREQSFIALRRLMAVHETAEEEVVHPTAKHAIPDGERIVKARLKEENEAKKVLTELEKLSPRSAEFETKLRALQAAVLAHAESEEREEFAALSDKLDTSRLEKMRKAAEFAESIAPTRPHAGVESAMANLLIGPFAAMVDRVRDAIGASTSRKEQSKAQKPSGETSQRV